MRAYFFDASAIVKLVLDETGSKAVRKFIAEPHVVRTTWLSLAEAYGVVKRRWQKDKWTPAQYYRKIFYFQRNIQKRVKLCGSVDLGSSDLGQIKNIHEKYSLDFSDAFHIVLLQSGFRASLTGASKPVLVAADRKLLKAAKAENIVTWNPERNARPPK